MAVFFFPKQINDHYFIHSCESAWIILAKTILLQIDSFACDLLLKDTCNALCRLCLLLQQRCATKGSAAVPIPARPWRCTGKQQILTHADESNGQLLFILKLILKFPYILKWNSHLSQWFYMCLVQNVEYFQQVVNNKAREGKGR